MNKRTEIARTKALLSNYRGIANFHADSYTYLLKNEREFSACVVNLNTAGFMRVVEGLKVFTYHSKQGAEFHIKFDLPKDINPKGEFLKSIVAIKALKNVENVIKKDHFSSLS